MIYAGISETGLAREENQDAIFMDIKGSIGCFGVADGMGGHESGEKASLEVMDCINKWWIGVQEPDSIEAFMGLVQEAVSAIELANINIRKKIEPRSVCGSTVVIILVWCTYYAVLHAGDSRAYLIDKKCRVKQLTLDDVWENKPELIKRKSKLKKYSTYGKLTNAVGVDDSIKITMKVGLIENHAGFFLCSDGLYKMVDERSINQILKSMKNINIELIIDQIRRKVYQNGAADNVSFILVKV